MQHFFWENQIKPLTSDMLEECHMNKTAWRGNRSPLSVSQLYNQKEEGHINIRIDFYNTVSIHGYYNI